MAASGQEFDALDTAESAMRERKNYYRNKVPQLFIWWDERGGLALDEREKELEVHETCSK